MAVHQPPHVDAHITYVDKEGPLIKIFAQIDKTNALFVERFLYQLRDVFTKSADLKPKTMNDIAVGLVCCAKFEDNIYYRARIVNLDGLREYKVTVFFIDHGNVAQVNVTDIRLLAKLPEVCPGDKKIACLVELKDLAEEYYLGGVAPNGISKWNENHWDDETVDLLRKTVCNTDGKCLIYECEGKKVLKFTKNDSDPAQLLINWEKGFDLPLQILGEYIKKMKSPHGGRVRVPLPQQINISLPPPNVAPPVQPQARLPNLSQPPPLVRGSNEMSSVSNTITNLSGPNRVGVQVRPSVPGIPMMRKPQASIPVQNHQFSTEMLTPGVSHLVYVSHVEDGPHGFAVQLQSVVQEVLTRMMLDLNNIDPQPIMAPLNPGSICVGRYSGDKTLCRAIVMNVMDNKVKLYFADFGNSEVVPFSEVYQIPPQFVIPKVMSHRFTLANITDVTYTENEKKLFKDLVANSQNLMMKVTPPEANPLRQYCELYLNCKNIKTILAELSTAQQHLFRYQPVSTPVKGSQEKVFVSYVVNPGRFFVQLDKNDYSLNQVMKQVADHCLRAPHLPLTKLGPGEPCCALFDDGIWYRAEIIKLIPEKKALINFVDFGNEEEIELTNLRQINLELVNSLRAQAVLCCLKGYDNRHIVEDEIANRLEELILEQKLIMHVLDYMEYHGDNALVVRLIDYNGIDISSQLEEATQPPPPVSNNYQAPTKPAYASPPAAPSDDNADGGWEETSVTTQQRKNWGQSDSRGPSDDKKSWRSREDGESGPRFNKDGFRFNRDEEGTGRFNRDENKKFGDRNSRFGDEDKSSRFNRESDSRGSGKFDDDKGGGRFNKEDGGGRFNRDSESRGGRINEERGNRFNREDGEKSSWRKRDDDTGGLKPKGDREDNGSWKPRGDREDGSNWKPRGDREDTGGWKPRGDREDAGGWKPRGDREDGGGWKPKGDREDGGGWKPKGDREWKPRGDREEGSGWKPRGDTDGGGGGGWKPKGGREEGSGWKSNRDRDEGGGDRRNRFDGDKRGGFNRDSGDRGNFRKPWDKGGGDGGFSMAAPKSPKPDTVGGMPPSPVKVGQTEKVEVCFTTSPFDFYVQLSSTFEELTQLMDKIAAGCDSGEISDTTSVQEKSGCLAKYSEDDSWYRAIVIEKSFDTVKVLFVDYGNEESVPLDKIKTLPEDMSTLHVQAIKCRLLGVPETAETEAFKALVEGKPLKAQFVAKHFLSKSFEVVIVDEENNSNINVAMGASEDSVQTTLSKLGSLELMTLSYSAGTTLSTQMTWYISPSQFYLQPMASNSEFRAMMQAMQDIVRSGTVKQNSDLNVGEYVIARFKADKVLYRALVQEAGFVPKVKYVDYGNIEAVDSGKVWAMEPQFATLPIQAFSCCLAGVQPTGETWPKPDSTELDSYFEAETLDCSVLKVVETEGNPQYLVKVVKQNEDVAQKIIEAGFATAGADAVGVPNELDTSLIVGQTLPVTLLRIQEDYTFFVQFAAEDVELQSLEFEAGQGVKCVLSNVKQDATDEQREAFTQLPANTYIIVLVDAVQSEGLQVTLFDGEGQLLALQENEVQSVEKVCPMPVLNTHQKVWVAHAGEDGIFLHKVEFVDLISELLAKLYEFYNDSEPVEQEWKHGDLCCAKSVNDEQWYRARILESEEETKVQYIDYGNTETVPISNLRQLDALFYTQHAFALPVSLHVSWTVPVENLMELAGEIEYNAVVLRNKDGWVVELVDSAGQSLTEKLVELGFAVALENSPFKRVVEGGRFAEGSDVPITVSFVDSPLQLWVHVGGDIELIEALQDRLQEAAPKLLPLKEATGNFAAKYFCDGQWYRAAKLDDSTVRFIDYGNSDVVDMSDIKALSPDFLEPAEGYAVKVELPVLDFKEGASDKLEELLISSEIDNEEEVVAHILSVKVSSIVADIRKGGKSIVDILVEENLATKLQKVSSGFVSNFNNLNDFYIQEVGCEESLDIIVNALIAAESFEPVSTINEGDIIAALYSEDGLWYRAKVTKKSEEEIEVLFIDYGNSAFSSRFMTLPSSLAEKPALSKNCALQLPEGVGEWSESANEKFMEISAEGCTQFDIKVVTEGNPAIVVLYNNENCVNEDLKSYCDVEGEGTVKTECASADLTGYDKCVYISHINNANDFYVQEDGAEAILDVIREELTDVSSFEALEKITDDFKGKIVGALFVDDEMWYRAKVLSITEDGAEVLFIDYGNSATATQFVKLPEVLEAKSPVALHCALGKENWLEEANTHFVTLGGEGTVPFSMKILEDSEPTIVSLALEEGIVEELLRMTLVAQPSNAKRPENSDVSPSKTVETLEKTADENIIKTVFLIHVNTPNDFSIQSAEATQLLAGISEQLGAAEEFSPIDKASISKGKIVAAQFDEDDLWYRARIIEHSEKETKVIFIDYGNCANVAKVKELPDDLVKTPALSMNCSLFKPGGGEWSQKACETFNKLANEDGVTFDLKIVSEGDPKLVSLYVKGESVAEQLILASGIVTEEPLPEESEEFEEPKKKIEDNLAEVVDYESAEVKLETDTEKFSDKQGEMGEMIMNCVNEKIINNTQREMQQITEDLISTAVDNTLLDMQQITEDLITKAANFSEIETPPSVIDSKVNNAKREIDEEIRDLNDEEAVIDSVVNNAISDIDEELKDLSEEEASSSSVIDSEVKNAIREIDEELKDFNEEEAVIDSEVNNAIREIDEEIKDLNEEEAVIDSIVNNAISDINEEIKDEVDHSFTTSNGICDNQVEIQDVKEETKNVKHANESTVPESETKSTKHDNSKTDIDGSPTTPRRHNIDEHIVPGCISSIKLEEPSEK